MALVSAESTAERFLRSALSEENGQHSTQDVLRWLHSTSADRQLNVRQVALDELSDWPLDPQSGARVHRSGKFFQVRGIHVQADLGPIPEWDQPIINQPEIGILGIIAREIDGQLYLLMQAKMEPGNPLGVQLVPTVEATRSNYTQVHQGTLPAYVEYFLDAERSHVLVDQLQYEQGSAFLRKRNRNIVVEVDREIPVLDGFRWLTLAQVKKLLSFPNLVGMEARTVVSCMSIAGLRTPRITPAQALDPFATSLLDSFLTTSAHSTDEAIMSWLTDLKCQHHLHIQERPLDQIEGWTHAGDIRRQDGRFFSVVGVEVEADSREVIRWNQPLIGSTEQGLIGFVTAEIDGVLHFLAQGRSEPGGGDTVIVGPTVQCALGYERRADKGLPFQDVMEYPASGQVRYSCVQSEEGGRFYRVENEYRVVQVDSARALDLPPNFTWMTGRQLQDLLRFGLVNVEARSLLACLSLT